LFRYLADAIEEDFEHNSKPLADLYRWFTIACIALSSEVVLWLLALGLD
jgi:hypothetical protein